MKVNLTVKRRIRQLIGYDFCITINGRAVCYELDRIIYFHNRWRKYEN